MLVQFLNDEEDFKVLPKIPVIEPKIEKQLQAESEETFQVLFNVIGYNIPKNEKTQALVQTLVQESEDQLCQTFINLKKSLINAHYYDRMFHENDDFLNLQELAYIMNNCHISTVDVLPEEKNFMKDLINQLRMTNIFNQDFIKSLSKRLGKCKKALGERDGKSKLLITILEKKIGILIEFSEKFSITQIYLISIFENLADNDLLELKVQVIQFIIQWMELVINRRIPGTEDTPPTQHNPSAVAKHA